MKNTFPVILALLMLAGPVSAEMVQSTTSVYLTFRECIEGETACDSVSNVKVGKYGGLPGDSEAHSSQDDPGYGKSTGRSKLADSPGEATLEAAISSLPGARNGSNSYFFQRYTNKGTHRETLTFGGKLTYEQTVPASNANFPVDKGGHSSAFAELEIFSLSMDAIDVGVTASDNGKFLNSELPPGVVHQSLSNTIVKGNQNESGAGKIAVSGTVSLDPGESVWMLAILQAIGSHGTEVKAVLDTKTTIKVHNE